MGKAEPYRVEIRDLCPRELQSKSQQFLGTITNNNEMLNFPTSHLSRTVSNAVFEKLVNFWQQMATRLEQGLIVGEEHLQSVTNIRFKLLLAADFSALLVGEIDCHEVHLDLTFDPGAISLFLQQLIPQTQDNFELNNYLVKCTLPRPINNPKIQSEFTLELLDFFTPSKSSSTTCQSLVDQAINQQLKQEKLLNQVISQIRQSLDLQVILSTAVEQVRHFLQVDRLVIYQFDLITTPTLNSTIARDEWGSVTYESRASDQIYSVLNLTEGENFSMYIPGCQDKYRRGITVAIGDISEAYNSDHCLYKFLQQYQIKAKLIAPIIVKDKLWGLLIAHQCFRIRQWQESEQKFLGEIAEHLSVAIYQAQLFSQVQKQKQTLEKRVIERTQELRDAMLAAQSASRSKSEFLAAMSHELRTPLTCVIGLASTLLHWSDQDNLPHVSIDKQQHYLQTILDSGKHLLELINDILDVSEIEAGKIVLNLSNFSLNQLSRDLIQTLQPNADHRQINLQLELKIKPGSQSFCGDSSRVKQILYNLLGNAIKFTPAGGTVTLRVWQETNQAVWQIEDTGIGIAKDNFPLLFEKFQQLETTYHRTYEGTGLGLALTKQLVELHGGIITVDSVVGEGSTFTVRLPHQSPSRSKQTTNQVVEHQRCNQKTLVLVEHDDEIATVICELLTAADYQVVWLMNGVTAITQIELLQPQAVIIDRDLPGIEIAQLSQSLKGLPSTSLTKLLVISGQISTPEHPEWEQINIDDVVLKPIQPQQLLQKVNQALKTSLS